MFSNNMLREAAMQGRSFTTASGFTFSPGPTPGTVVGLTESGRSVAVSGATSGLSPEGQMDEDDLAGFLGLESGSQLGGAQAGLGSTGPTAGETGGISAGVSGGDKVRLSRLFPAHTMLAKGVGGNFYLTFSQS